MIGNVPGRAVQFVSVALFALPLSGCLYVPPVWDISDPNNNVEAIRVGETTRGEVLVLLGENPSVCAGSSPQNSRWYRYSGTHSAGRLAYAGGDRTSLAETPWYVNVYFNEDNVVESIDANPPPSARPQVSGVPFEQQADTNAPTAPPPELFLDRSCSQP